MSRWLDVEVGTDDINLNTLSSTITLIDLNNDNDMKLLVGDFGRREEPPKLKIFKGTMQVSDQVLPDFPLGIAGLYTSEAVSRALPVLAVAFSSCIHFYRDFKLFYKYFLPSSTMSVSEIDTWKHLKNPENHNPEAIVPFIESLKSLPEKIISKESQEFISMSTNQQLEYLETITDVPEKKVPELSCITTMKMSSIEKNAVSCLVVGAEDGTVIILDPQTLSQLAQASISATPYQMIATGLFNVDFRITIATREKSVYLVKRDWIQGRLLFSTDDHLISMEVMTTDQSIVVICADNTLTCYSKKGKKQWYLNLEHRPVTMTLFPILHLGVTLVGVALASGHVHLYDGKAKRDTIFVRDVASVMKFGQLGQQEHVFIIVTAGGNLMLKILRRTADFNAPAMGVDTSIDATMMQKPWLIPKKSKLFLEQSLRERENAIAMHETFQRDMNRLRLQAAKTLLDAHLKSDNFIGVGALEPIRLSAEVEGLGPVFRMWLIIENTSPDKAVVGLSALFYVHTSNYKLSQPYIKVPLLSPGSKLKFPTKIEEVFDDTLNPDIFLRTVTGQGGERSLIKILLLKEDKQTPVLAATVQMPPTDPMMVPYDKMQENASLKGEEVWGT